MSPESSLRPLFEDTIARLRQHAEVDVWPDSDSLPRDELLRRLRDVDAVLCLLADRIDAEALDAGPRLRIVANMAVGYDNIDVPAATRRSIVVTNTPGVLTETTADLTFALLLAAARRVAEGDRFVRAGGWKTWSPSLLLGHDVHDATLGVVGMGQIGLAVARRARGFNMRILYTDIEQQPEAEAALGAERVDLDRLLRESDFVSLHVFLAPETRHLIGERELSLMKSTAILVNAARGPVVDQPALYRALAEGRIAAAGLDVAEVEPIPLDDPLLTLENVVITPHIGSATIATRLRMANMAAENIEQALRGELPSHCLNPQAFGRATGNK